MGGLQCLAAFLKKHGHDAALVNDPRLLDNPWIQMPQWQRYVDTSDQLLNEVLDHKPDLIGFSVVADDYQWALAWSKKIKQKMNIPIVFGNIYPTTNPNEVLENIEVDFVVRGEGEITLLELVNELESSQNYESILGLGFKNNGEIKVNALRPLIEDLDILPFPDKDLSYREMPYLDFGYTTMTGRGCPYRCTFCDNNTSREIYKQGTAQQKWTRRHSPEYVVRELQWAKEQYNIKHIRFNDEDFSYDKRWTYEFCRLYKESGLNIPWFAWVYPNTIDDDVAMAMADAGCDSVEMGVQTGSQRLRRDIIHRVTPNDRIISSMLALRKAGIRCTVDVIVGLPTETEDDLYETANLLVAGKPWHIYAFWLRYYSHTEIAKIAMRLNVLDKSKMDAIQEGKHSRGHLAGGTEREMSAVTRSFHTFILLIPVLPDGLAKWILKNKWVKYVPHINPFVLVNVTKSFKPNPFDEFRVRTIQMYIFEFKKMFKRAFGYSNANSSHSKTSNSSSGRFRDAV